MKNAAVMSVNISGAGLLVRDFVNPEPFGELSPGDTVVVDIAVGTPELVDVFNSPHTVSLCGEVVRKDESMSWSGVAVKFLCPHDVKREVIVRFVLAKEREMLFSKKMRKTIEVIDDR
jgi:hypothetical protein